MARRWPKAQAPLKPKYKKGDIVRKSSTALMREANRDGEELEDIFGTGSDLFLYILRPHNHEYLAQVIPDSELQGVGRIHKGRFGFVEAAKLRQTKKEKSMTDAEVYDGKDFHRDRMSKAGRLAFAGEKSKKGGDDR